MAKDLIPGQQRLEPDEVLQIVEMPLHEAMKGIRDGMIIDAKTIAGLSVAYLREKGW